MKKLLLLLLVTPLMLLTYNVMAQNVGIGATGANPDPSAMLDVNSTSKGMLVPRMSTAQRNAIANPAIGLLVFDSTEKTLFMYDGTNWLGFAALSDFNRPANNFAYNPDNADTLLTGYSVSMWDQYAAAGVPYKRQGSIYTGGVYIYKKVGANWQYSTTLLPPTINNFSLYGLSVCLRGNYLIVGATGQLDLASNPVGAAYIYYYNGTSWSLLQTIYGNTGGATFGTVVTINQFGNYVAISEPGATVSGLPNGGRIHIYYKAASTFSFQTYLTDPAPAVNEFFGSVMAMSSGGSHILVGAPDKTVGGHFGNGYVGQFDRSGVSSWSQTHTYTPIGEDNLNIGALVDITDLHAIWLTGKTRQISLADMSWTGYGAPPISGVTNINGIALDPTTEEPYIFADNAVYAGYYGALTKIKTLNTDYTSFPNLQLFSVYARNFMVGLPYGPTINKPYIGAVYFGIAPQ